MSCTIVTSMNSQCIWETMKIPNVNVNTKIFNDDEILYFQMMNYKCDKNKICSQMFLWLGEIFFKSLMEG